MKLRKIIFSATSVILLFLLGISSAYFSRSACEQQSVVTVFIAGGAFAPPRISAHKTEIDGETYDFSDSKVIVDNTLLCRPKLQSILLNRQREQHEFADLADKDSSWIYSFSHGKVVFPFVVVTDVEVGNDPTDGTRIYYFTFFSYIWKIKHKATYRIDSVSK